MTTAPARVALDFCRSRLDREDPLTTSSARPLTFSVDLLSFIRRSGRGSSLLSSPALGRLRGKGTRRSGPHPAQSWPTLARGAGLGRTEASPNRIGRVVQSHRPDQAVIKEELSHERGRVHRIAFSVLATHPRKDRGHPDRAVQFPFRYNRRVFVLGRDGGDRPTTAHERGRPERSRCITPSRNVVLGYVTAVIRVLLAAAARLVLDRVPGLFSPSPLRSLPSR